MAPLAFCTFMCFAFQAMDSHDENLLPPLIPSLKIQTKSFDAMRAVTRLQARAFGTVLRLDDHHEDDADNDKVDFSFSSRILAFSL